MQFLSFAAFLRQFFGPRHWIFWVFCPLRKDFCVQLFQTIYSQWRCVPNPQGALDIDPSCNFFEDMGNLWIWWIWLHSHMMSNHGIMLWKWAPRIFDLVANESWRTMAPQDLFPQDQVVVGCFTHLMSYIYIFCHLLEKRFWRIFPHNIYS